MTSAPRATTTTDDDAAAMIAGMSAEGKAALARMRRVNPSCDPATHLPDLCPARIPRHIAIIMDGNGRWAQERGFARIFGHRNGARAVRETVEACGRIGVEVLTLFSFSLENWKRPADEVRALMDLCETYCEGEAAALARENIRFRVAGKREGLPDKVRAALEMVEAVTAGAEGPTLCLALNYGGRAEIVHAARALAERVRRGEIEPDAIDDRAFENELWTAGLPDPDLLIRTAGEMRVSNFLLWQISYAELFVTETLWPDFGEAELHKAVRAFAGRRRRFGGLESEDARVEPAGGG